MTPHSYYKSVGLILCLHYSSRLIIVRFESPNYLMPLKMGLPFEARRKSRYYGRLRRSRKKAMPNTKAIANPIPIQPKAPIPDPPSIFS